MIHMTERQLLQDRVIAINWILWDNTLDQIEAGQG